MRNRLQLLPILLLVGLVAVPSCGGSGSGTRPVGQWQCATDRMVAVFCADGQFFMDDDDKFNEWRGTWSPQGTIDACYKAVCFRTFELSASGTLVLKWQGKDGPFAEACVACPDGKCPSIARDPCK